MENKNKPKKLLCPDCKTGMESYIIDENSPVCPYLDCYDGYNCGYYVPMEDSADDGELSKNREEL